MVRANIPDMSNGLDVGVRRLRKGPLFVAVAMPLVFAFLGGALAGGSGVYSSTTTRSMLDQGRNS